MTSPSPSNNRQLTIALGSVLKSRKASNMLRNFISSLLVLAPIESFALDHFLILRSTGPHGDAGNSLIELSCVKEACEISTLKNETITAKTMVSRMDADAYFKTAQKALSAPHRAQAPRHALVSIHTEVEWKNQKLESATLGPEILLLEKKLRARLR